MSDSDVFARTHLRLLVDIEKEIVENGLVDDSLLLRRETPILIASGPRAVGGRLEV